MKKPTGTAIALIAFAKVKPMTEEADGGCVAEWLTESMVAQDDNWDELRANVKGAVEEYFYDGEKPDATRLHLVRDEGLLMR